MQIMRILDIYINGYRSLANVRWQPERLNVLIGPNGSGKSNLLRALELLLGAAHGDLSERVRREGGMGATVFDGEMEGVTLDLIAGSNEEAFVEDSVNTRYRIEMDRIGKTSSFSIGREFLGPNDEFENMDSGLINRVNGGGSFFSAIGSETRHELTDLADEKSSLSSFGNALTLNPEIKAYQRFIGDWHVYGHLDTSMGAEIRRAAVTRRETTVDSDGQNLIPVLHTLYSTDREFKNELDLAMKAAFGDEFEELVFPPEADQRVQMQVRWRSLKRPQPAADLSDGTLRFLFLLAVLANPNPSSLIAIDEPESGLHPSMLPIIAEFARDASIRSQVVLTTHSPEFLDAFGSEAPNTVIVGCHDGTTSMTAASGEKLQYWLKQYTLGELFRSNELETMQ